MTGETPGASSPDQLYASVYGHPVSPELARQQYADLEQQLQRANHIGDSEEIESIQEQLRQLREACPEM